MNEMKQEKEQYENEKYELITEERQKSDIKRLDELTQILKRGK